MSKTTSKIKEGPKLKPGIHLYKTTGGFSASSPDRKPEWYWHIVSKNGRIIARSSETYTRKGNAVKSIRVAAKIFILNYDTNGPMYYDHSKPDSTLQSYL
jgi:uncharacterized protein YegP (UPF0339 family)